MNGLVFWESIHGHLGTLALIALIHPAVLLRKGKVLSFGKKLSVILSTLLTVTTFAIGLLIYPSYRTQVKPELWLMSSKIALLFETKEHIAFFVLSTSLSACFVALLAPKSSTQLRKISALLFGCAALGCLVVAALGIVVSSVKGF